MSNISYLTDKFKWVSGHPHFLEAWSFMENEAEDKGIFKNLITTVESIGKSGYQLMLTVGIIGLAFSIIMTAISLLMTSNSQKKEEKKSHALIICIAGIVIFSVFAILGFLQSIGSGLGSETST